MWVQDYLSGLFGIHFTQANTEDWQRVPHNCRCVNQIVEKNSALFGAISAHLVHTSKMISCPSPPDLPRYPVGGSHTTFNLARKQCLHCIHSKNKHSKLQYHKSYHTQAACFQEAGTQKAFHGFPSGSLSHIRSDVSFAYASLVRAAAFNLHFSRGN